MTLMPIKKSIVILRMLDIFLSEGVLTKEQILSSVDMSEISFKRYIGEIRDYLRFYHPSWQVRFKRSNYTYVLDKGNATPNE
jgi:hypothetical protein